MGPCHPWPRPFEKGSTTMRFFPARWALGLVAAAASPCASAPAATPPAQQVMRAGSQPSMVGPAEYFPGRVRVAPVWPADGDIPASGGTVTFEPGARSAWHTHPKGQRLVVLSGVG